MYEARKKSQGGDRRSEEFSKDQIDPLNRPHSTTEAIAREIGVAEPTIKRSGEFAAGLALSLGIFLHSCTFHSVGIASVVSDLIPLRPKAFCIANEVSGGKVRTLPLRPDVIVKRI